MLKQKHRLHKLAPAMSAPFSLPEEATNNEHGNTATEPREASQLAVAAATLMRCRADADECKDEGGGSAKRARTTSEQDRVQDSIETGGFPDQACYIMMDELLGADELNFGAPGGTEEARMSRSTGQSESEFMALLDGIDADIRPIIYEDIPEICDPQTP